MDGASPGTRLRLPATGGAGPSPHADVSRCVPGGRNCGQDKGGWKVWDKIGCSGVAPEADVHLWLTSQKV